MALGTSAQGPEGCWRARRAGVRGAWPLCARGGYCAPHPGSPGPVQRPSRQGRIKGFSAMFQDKAVKSERQTSITLVLSLVGGVLHTFKNLRSGADPPPLGMRVFYIDASQPGSFLALQESRLYIGSPGHSESKLQSLRWPSKFPFIGPPSPSPFLCDPVPYLWQAVSVGSSHHLLPRCSWKMLGTFLPQGLCLFWAFWQDIFISSYR